jgi:putative endonuclease
MQGGWVYIVTNRPNGTLYVGVTGGPARRLWEHREGVADGFTKKYGLRRLVWAERHDDIRTAIQREHNLNTGHAPGKSSSSSRVVLAGTISMSKSHEYLDGRIKSGHDGSECLSSLHI